MPHTHCTAPPCLREMGGAITQEGSLGSLGGGTQTFYGGEAAARFFQDQYAPRAKLQADAVAPVLKSFFDDSPLPPSEWVDVALAGGLYQMPLAAPSTPPGPPAFPPLLAPAVTERSHLYDGPIGNCNHTAAWNQTGHEPCTLHDCCCSSPLLILCSYSPHPHCRCPLVRQISPSRSSSSPLTSSAPLSRLSSTGGLSGGQLGLSAAS